MENQNNTIMHSHDFCEIAVVTAGRGTQQFYSHEGVKAEKGDVFIIPTGTVHAYADVDGMSVVNILMAAGKIPIPELDLGNSEAFKYFAKSKAQRLRVGGDFLYLKLTGEELTEANRIILSIKKEQTEGRPGCDFACYGLLLELISLLCRCEYLCGEVSGRSKYMNLAVEAVSKSLNKTRPICDLAKESGMSERSFRRQFKKASGLAPSKYLIAQRLSEGAKLLVASDIPIDEIAIKCGFCDGSYFTKMFRKNFGVTPKNYRRQNARSENV